ncbi:MAG TPA: GntR family transcriptional regulator [Microbacteriaceae bacterium]|nr:GntR family transcriptional regulator [Microbacteriaceae bacterium]
MTDDAHAELTREIRDAILAGEFVAGQRLVEADLTARFGASRSGVRLALVNLANEGLVDRLPNRGARVRSISRDEAVEIAEVRIGLEVLCARKAAESLADDEAEELRELRARMTAAVAASDLVGYSALIQEFDRQLREFSGHVTAAQLLQRLHAQSARHQFRLAFAPGRAQKSLGQHLAIVDAVLARDPEAAERATRAHLEDVVGILAALD